MSPRLLIAALGATALLAGGYGLGYRAGEAAEKGRAWRAEALGLQAAVQRLERSTAAANQIAGDLAAKVEAEHARTVTLIKEVPIHVSGESDARFPVPVGLVRLHDAAAIGVDMPAVSDPAGRADGEASDVVASDLAAVIVENYGDCRADMQRLAAWQAWADGQAAIFAAKSGR